MSAREKWEPTDVERIEHDKLHARAQRDHAAAHVKQYTDCQCAMCQRYRTEPKDELLS